MSMVLALGCYFAITTVGAAQEGQAEVSPVQPMAIAADRVRELGTYRGLVTAVAFSWDGSLLVSGGKDRSIRIWDAARGVELQTLQDMYAPAVALALSFDHKRLAAGGPRRRVTIQDRMRSTSFWTGGAVKIWNRSSGDSTPVLEGIGSWVCGIAFDWHSDSRIVTLDLDQTLRVWDMREGRESQRLSCPGVFDQGGFPAVPPISFGEDANRAVSLGVCRTGPLETRLVLWDLAESRARAFAEPGANLAAISPDGQWVAVVRVVPRSVVQIYRFNDFRLISEWSTPADRRLTFLAFSPGDGEVIAADQEGRLSIWGRQSGRMKQAFLGPRGSVRAVSFPRGNLRIATGGHELGEQWDPQTQSRPFESLKLWDAKLAPPEDREKRRNASP